jgi:hypothetical protein
VDGLLLRVALESLEPFLAGLDSTGSAGTFMFKDFSFSEAVFDHG